MATSYDETSYLAHFGVKGMKWGVRRSESHPQGVDRSKMAKGTSSSSSGRSSGGPTTTNVRAMRKQALKKAQATGDAQRAKLSKEYDAHAKVGTKAYLAEIRRSGSVAKARRAEVKTTYALDDATDRKHDAVGLRQQAAEKAAKQAAKDAHKQNVQTQREAARGALHTGKGVASAVLVGPGATYGYSAARAAGASKGKAATLALTTGPLAGATYRKIKGQ